MIITVPDEICVQICSHAGATLTPTGIQDAVLKTLKKALDNGMDGDCVVFNDEQIQLLHFVFGFFKDSTELLAKIKRLGALRVQGKEYLLNAEQMKRLRMEAFGNVNPGEPRSEGECKTVEQKEKIVNRYVGKQIDYFMKQMCSQI